MRQQLTSAQLIVELVSADARRGQQFDPPLNHAELAFYDAVAQNGAATELMGVGTLAEIARELVKSIQSSITVDWFSREPVRAKLRSHIRRLLARYDHPPDHERAAVDLVIRQMETFANEWAPGGQARPPSGDGIGATCVCFGYPAYASDGAANRPSTGVRPASVLTAMPAVASSGSSGRTV
nr:type I restriction enzyme endonuclease domain-containing protein [Micromonospora craniellae]